MRAAHMTTFVHAADALDTDDEGTAERAASNGAASTSQRAAARAHENGGAADGDEGGNLLSERVAPRALEELPPLFTRLDERPAESLQYLGVSFGLTAPLLKFWQRQGFSAVYLRQTASDVTGEHTCIVLKALASPEVEKQVRAAACVSTRGRMRRCVWGAHSGLVSRVHRRYHDMLLQVTAGVHATQGVAAQGACSP